MELRAYASVLARRWLIIVLLPLAAALAIVVYDGSRKTQYTAESRLSVSRLSGESTDGEYEFDDYYDLLSSDFILDDTAEIVRGNVFAAAVAERLQGQGIEVQVESVANALAATREHRILSIDATTDDEGLAIVIANVAAIELQEDFADYLGVEGDPLPITIRPVEVPIAAESDDLRVRLTYIMALVVAVGFGVLLALLVEYFDDSLDLDAAETALGIDLLGVVRDNDR